MNITKLTPIEKISIYRQAKSILLNTINPNEEEFHLGLCGILTDLLIRSEYGEVSLSEAEFDPIEYTKRVEFIGANLTEFLDDFSYETMCTLHEIPFELSNAKGYWWPIHDTTSRLIFLDKLIEKNEKSLTKNGIITSINN